MASPAWAVCPICNAKQATPTAYGRHMSRIHPASEPTNAAKFQQPAFIYACGINDCRFIDKSIFALATHQQSTHGLLQCSRCKTTSPTKNAFYDHDAGCLLECRQECSMCLETYDSNEAMIQHLVKKHKAVPCTECHRAYKNNTSLSQHISSVHQKDVVVCAYCSDVFATTDERLLHYHTTHTDAAFWCPVPGCDKHDTILTRLKHHILIVHDQYYCIDCKLLFVTFRAFTEHESTAHRRSVFTCPACNDVFDTVAGLKHHARRLHGKKYCDDCNLLLSIEEFDGHMDALHPQTGRRRSEYAARIKRVRTVKRPVVHYCSLCTDLKQYTEHDLHQHMASAHDLYTVICDVCQARILPSEYNEHMSSHIPLVPVAEDPFLLDNTPVAIDDAFIENYIDTIHDLGDAFVDNATVPPEDAFLGQYMDMNSDTHGVDMALFDYATPIGWDDETASTDDYVAMDDTFLSSDNYQQFYNNFQTFGNLEFDVVDFNIPFDNAPTADQLEWNYDMY